MEKLYLIVACPHCHMIQVVDGRNKTRSCAGCYKRFETKTLAALGRSNDAREARKLAAGIKASRALVEDQR